MMIGTMDGSPDAGWSGNVTVDHAVGDVMGLHANVRQSCRVSPQRQ